ncbi:MAG: alpha/beta hydrolase [Parasporobacterium sp.]|nr:alpha/beta hydrolase [Parasporobacterium sp.]
MQHWKGKTMIKEVFELNKSRNVTLTSYRLALGGEFGNISKRPAVLVIPGGGYMMCSDREADPVAISFLQAGFNTFVLRYSVAEHRTWPNPLEDYEQAMTMIREKSDEWGIFADKIAVIGFSAGGHLAACAATIAKNKPNAAILGYAVIHGAELDPDIPDLAEHVDDNTCPCFMFGTRNDHLVSVHNALDFQKALANHDITFESHIYGYGPHGFSTAAADLGDMSSLCSRASSWVKDSVGWLFDIFGDFEAVGLGVPRCKPRTSADKDPFLSVDCSFALLMSRREARNLVMEVMEKYSSSQEPSMPVSDTMAEMFAKMPLRDTLFVRKVPAEAVEELNNRLNAIPNVIK